MPSPTPRPRIVIIGGGVGGVTAARSLRRAGADVTVLEASPNLGGLVMSLEIAGTPIEAFYHHIFPQEHAIRELIDGLGLTPKLAWLQSSTGVLTGGKVWPFTTPQDLLRFKPLSPVQRVRAGAGALKLQSARSWEALDTLAARDWVRSACGVRTAEVLWDPMLRTKFARAWESVPAAFLFGRFDQRRGARKEGSEKLGYLRGGFRQLFDALAVRLPAEGIDLRLATQAQRIVLEDGKVTGVDTGSEVIAADAVLFAGTLPNLAKLVDAEHLDPRWTATDRLGAMCVLLELDQPLSDQYWVNICDARLPFGALIEHTNFVPADDYQGRRVVYLGRYFTPDEDIATTDPEKVADEWIAALRAVLPSAAAAKVLNRQVARTPYAAPLVQLGHATRIPPIRTHLGGLYISTTVQIYPHDRGMSDGIVLAAEAATAMAKDLGLDASSITTWDSVTIEAPALETKKAGEAGWVCPVCGRTTSEPLWDSAGEGGECGVTGTAVRPSADLYGELVGKVVRCTTCGHGSLAARPDEATLAAAYGEAADVEVSDDEHEGQRLTADRTIAMLETVVEPGALLDVGCWTGSLVAAAGARGWKASGIDPSAWAVERGQSEGLDVKEGSIEDVTIEAGSLRAAVLCDVLEHLLDPGPALDVLHRAIEPDGALLITVPDAGSSIARRMGAKWWSVLPMHVQYFTRSSITRLLDEHGFAVVKIDTHPKVFTTRYYAGRLAGYSAAVAKAVTGALKAIGQAERMVAPDFRDRMLVIARPH